MEIAEVPGIEIAVAPSRGLLVYELRIPLLQTESHLVAVGAQPGRTIGIGFETPNPTAARCPDRRLEECPTFLAERPPSTRLAAA